MPRWLRRLRARIRYRRFDEDLRRELDVHRAMADADLAARGEGDVLSADARRAVVSRQLGNVALARDAARGVWIAPWLDGVRQDVGYAIRGLRRSPAFTLTALGALVIGIGLNLSLLTVANGLLFKPWPLPDPDRVVVVRPAVAGSAGSSSGLSPAEFRFLRQHATTIDLVAIRVYGVSIEDHDGSLVRVVSDNYFDTLRIPLVLGRGFRPEENIVGDPVSVAVISYRVWQDRYAGSRDVVGHRIRVNDAPFTIVGVAADGATDQPMAPPQAWIPQAATLVLSSAGETAEQIRNARERELAAQDKPAGGVTIAGRLRRGANLSQATAELAAIDREVQTARHQPPHVFAGNGTEAVFGIGHGDVRILVLIFVGATLLLGLACANVGNLHVARGIARRSEITIRLQLGASRWRVARQLMTEALALSLLGGAFSLVVAWTIPSIAMRVAGVQQATERWRMAPDSRVIIAAIALSTLSCVLFALAPAVRSTRSIVAGRDRAMRDRSRLRSGLLAVQIALGTVLVAATSLLARGVVHAASIDPGFDLHGIAAVSLTFPKAVDTARRKAVFASVTDAARTARLPPLAIASAPPLAGGFIGAEARRSEQGESSDVFVHVEYVSPNYFDVLRIPLVAGASLSATSGTDDVIVNQTLARMLWGTANDAAVGQPVIANGQAARVVGVAADAQTYTLGHVEPTVYFVGTTGTLLVANDPAVLRKVKAIVTSIAPDVSATTQSLADNVARDLADARTGVLFAGSLGLVALVLAGVGTFGVFSYLVIERTHEIGVRTAIGARPRDVLGLMLARTSKALVGGVVAGLAVSAVLGPVLRRNLYGLSPRDPLAFAIVIAVLGAAALVATVVPLWRAVRIDPAVTLREE